jgi:hypothetical protein
MSPLRMLTIALAVQLLLGVVTWWPRDPSAGRPHALIDMPRDSITSVAIGVATAPGAEPTWVELERDGEKWTLASEAGYPANPAAVGQLLDRLTALQVRQPIATRPASHNALKVGDDEYGRRVRIGTAEGERELIIGAARSNSINVRFADASDVYVADGLSAFSLRETPDAYWIADYVKVPASEISQVRVSNRAGGFDAVRGESGWTLGDVEEDQVTDSDGLEEWLGEVATLRLQRPVSTNPGDLPGGAELARISWTIVSESESVAGGYALYDVGGDQILAKSDTNAFVVEVSPSLVEPLLSVTRGDLLRDLGDIEVLEDE